MYSYSWWGMSDIELDGLHHVDEILETKAIYDNAGMEHVEYHVSVAEDLQTDSYSVWSVFSVERWWKPDVRERMHKEQRAVLDEYVHMKGVYF